MSKGLVKRTIEIVINDQPVKVSYQIKLICDAITKYNYLRKFPLTPKEVFLWADSLVTIWPDLDPEAIDFVIDKMIAQEIECDGGGIQNIVKGLKRLDVDAQGNYFVKSDHIY